MRIAIPVWDERVSPIFDVARSIRIVDIFEDGISSSKDHRLENESRASSLAALGIDLVICAAISTPLAASLWVSGIKVQPDTCGSVDDIVKAYASGDTDLHRFRSPGYTREEPTKDDNEPCPGTTPRSWR